MNRSDASSSKTARSKLTAAESSQFSSRMEPSRPAVRARRSAEVVSRRVTSSDSTSSRNSPWLKERLLGQALGQGVEAAPELHAAKERLELGSDRRGGGAHAAPSLDASAAFA